MFSHSEIYKEPKIGGDILWEAFMTVLAENTHFPRVAPQGSVYTTVLTPIRILNLKGLS